MGKYASVIIDVSARNLDKPFTYIVPYPLIEQVEIGCVVIIPFGAGNRRIKGYVIDLPDTTMIDQNKLKEIIEIDENYTVESELIRIAYWMKKRYQCPFITALNSVIPTNQPVKKKYDKEIQLNISQIEAEDIISKIFFDKRLVGRKTALDALLKKGAIDEKTLLKYPSVTKAVLQSLQKNNVIKIGHKEIYRNPFDIDSIEKTENLLPNYEQQKAIYEIGKAVRDDAQTIFLLHGVTGSGKTEVYMQAIEQALKDNKQAIVLIPEISLTPQTVNRFIGRFGDRVGVMHSKLSQGEKYDQWRKAKEGLISIMVGPRSALFAPFSRLGIIIIDEEHETSYKASQSPRYHAREVAIKRGSIAKCPVVLGSATPLVESYYKAKNNQYKLLELPNKAHQRADLSVEIVDMREELRSGNKTIFSRELLDAMTEALEKKEQIILFLNRRGYANFVSCRECGYVIKCTNCDVPYTYHKDHEKLICHYCGKSIENVHVCPKCQSQFIRTFGIGTQRVENAVVKTFKNVNVIRMDLDTTVGKNSYQEILEQFGDKKADVLIGTQMVAKGHDFENVTVVGVIAADLSLYINDFRASEKTFQLITQVTGRAGRGAKKGKAIIQTYSPEHYSIQFSKEQNYVGFYDEEIKFRELMGYPPFSHIMNIMMLSENEEQLIKDAYKIKDILLRTIGENRVRLLGPTPATISKVKKVYRWKIMAKSSSYNLLTKVWTNFSIVINKNYQYKHITFQVDINPMMSF